MLKLNRTFLSTSALLLFLVACHSSSMDSKATVIPQPSLNPQPLPVTTIVPEVAPAQAIPVQEENKVEKVADVKDRMVYRLDSLMQDPFLQRSQLGLYIYDLTKKRPVYAYGMHQSMRPASTMKVITAVTALAQLGTDYKYTTRLYTTGTVQKHQLSGSLYVKGGFDPLTSNSTLNEFVAALVKKGITQVKGDLILDISMKDDDEAGWGWCWDDKNPSLCPLLYNEKPTFGTAFQQALQRRGIRHNGAIKIGRVPQNATNVCTHYTTIDEALKPMMKMSVNQVAESMFYQIGAQLGKPYITHRTSAAYVKQFIDRDLNLIPDNYRIADGSGLSLYNYITPELLVAALRYAYEHQDIYRHLLPSLPVAGEDGTLKNRMRFTSAHGNVCAKTGTVTGIASLAGYATTKDGHRLCFAIINQGQMKGSEARVFQDEVCYIITQ